ncbi:Meiotic recombination protein REC8 [Candida viswanathii]|uniref:Meiotic recombination protein REC8 n=1 Tax=Candida viswanathii TaxID=5486 RepID=A0A367Y376_9ASCO|nr:Meiotic recombination protein REC8 [Candida viswanathii]
MESINQSPEIASGLQTAWLLATLGSKTSVRSKLIKKDILGILIPKLCKQLTTPHQDQSHETNNIRYVSNIMYGISILYQTKINYFITDLAYIESRLRSSSNHGVLGRDGDGGGRGGVEVSLAKLVRKRGRYLDNDPCFSIQLGLMTPFVEEEGEDEVRKKRRIDIRERDKELFPISHEESLLVSNPLVFALTNVVGEVGQGDGEVLEDLIDHLGNMSSQAEDVIADDFQFNDNGEILDNDGQNVNEDEEQGSEGTPASLMDIVFEENEVHQEAVQLVGEASITNDLNFHTNDTPTAMQPPAQHQTLPRRRLVVDQQTRLNSEAIVSSALNYESTMESRINEKTTPVHSLDEVYLAAIIDGPAYLRYVNRIAMPFGNENTSDASSFTRTLSVLQRTEEAVTGEDPTEEGRDVVRSRGFVFNDEVPIDMIGGELRGNELPEETQRIFDIEFDYDEESQEHPRYQSRSLTESSDGLGTQDEEGEEMLDRKLKKFYRYLRDRSGDLGTLITGRYSIAKLSQNLTTNTECSFGDFYTTSFDQLVPASSEIEHEQPVNRRIAANSFSSILTLATKNLIAIEVDQRHGSMDDMFGLHRGDQINIIMPL